MTVTETISQDDLGLNQQIYHRLKAALSLNLRRQIFVAVCDDLALRNRLAARLHTELAYPSLASGGRGSGWRYPQLVSLNLNLSDPDPMTQIAQWLEQHPFPKGKVEPSLRVPGFQILGVERLTRQSPTVQRLFLSHLQRVEHTLPMLEASLVLWMPRPWCRMIQESAPEFWCWHTGLFEFQGDPTPVPGVTKGGGLSQGSDAPPAVGTTVVPPAPRVTVPSGEIPPPVAEDPIAPNPEPPLIEPSPVVVTRPVSPKESLWEILTQDLENLVEQPQVSASPTPAIVPQESDFPELSAPSTGSPTYPAVPILTAPIEPIDSHRADLTVPSTPSIEPIDSHRADLSILPTPPIEAIEAHQPEIVEPIELIDPPPIVSVNAPAIEEPAIAEPVAPNVPLSPLPLEEIIAEESLPSVEDAFAVTVEADPVPVEQPPAAPLPPVSGTPKAPRTQSLAALELADYVLASVTQEMRKQPPASNGTSALTVPEESQAAQYANFQPIQILEQIEQLHLQQATPAALAAAYRRLGNLYRDRIEQGQMTQQSLVISLRSYEQALTWLDDTSPLWSDILNDVGNLYWMLFHAPGSGERALTYLEQGIRAYQAALVKTNPTTRPHSYAMIQNNLGSAYGDLARHREPAENLRLSIQAYQEALRCRGAEDPQRYAATQNNLGTAFWNLAQQDKPVTNLSQAIVAYSEALKHCDPDKDALSFAMIQNNLGTAYWNLAQFETNLVDPTSGVELRASPEDLLRLAIGSYQIALIYRTPEVAPAAHAATQNNLGTACWHLANQPSTHYDDRREYLQQAINAYQAALEIAPQLKQVSFDRFATHNNLGLAFHQLASDPHSEVAAELSFTCLEQSLEHHLLALQGWDAKSDFYQTALGYVVQTVRTFYEKHGIAGQNAAFSQIPAQLLPEVMRKLG